jgi:mono/diheme cytochrome c family protein
MYEASRERMRRAISPAALAGVVVLVALASVAHAESDAQVAAGATIYQDYCGICHGEKLRNTSGGVTFDLRRLRAEDRERFLNVVLNGKNQMPPWKDVLDSDQINAIWSYIRATIDR